MMCSSFMKQRWEAGATVSPAVRIRHKLIGYKLTSVLNKTSNTSRQQAAAAG